MYGPRGVTIWGSNLLVCDTGNHRVLVFYDFLDDPERVEADLVIGQPDFTSETPNNGDPRQGLFMPTDAQVFEDKLFIADSWNHRIAIFEPVPDALGTKVGAVIGQADLVAVEPNRGSDTPSGSSLYWPFAMYFASEGFYVADTGNRRVLGWRDVYAAISGEPCDVVIGQDSPFDREENRGALGPDSFRWPHGLAWAQEKLFVTDAGNHRVLGFKKPVEDKPAVVLLGQPDMGSNFEWPYGPQGNDRLRFPYGIAADSCMAVADTANNRVLIWDSIPDAIGVGADRVLGQPDFLVNGENRWQEVAPDSFCWPYGIDVKGDVLAVADTGNNRVVIWRLEE
jgi:hypothetical protein